MKIGRCIYEEFSTVVNLQEQVCHGPGLAGLFRVIALWEGPTQRLDDVMGSPTTSIPH